MTKHDETTQQAQSDQLLAIRLQRQFDRENNLIDGAGNGDGESSADRRGDRKEEQCRADLELARRLAEEGEADAGAPPLQCRSDFELARRLAEETETDAGAPSLQCRSDFELARRLAEEADAGAPPLECRSDFELARRLAEDDGAPPLSPPPSRRGMIESGPRRGVESASAGHQATRQVESALIDDELWRQLKTSFLEAKDREGAYASVPPSGGGSALGAASAMNKSALGATAAKVTASDLGLRNAKVDALVSIGWLVDSAGEDSSALRTSSRTTSSSSTTNDGGFWSSLVSWGGEKVRGAVVGRTFFLADAMLEQIELVACLHEVRRSDKFYVVHTSSRDRRTVLVCIMQL